MNRVYETVRLDSTAEGLATITLTRPAQRNSINAQMMLDLYDALATTAANPNVRVLVLRGEGRDFCPGADIGNYASGEGRAQKAGWSGTREFDVATLLHEMKAVTIAAIKGGCAGAGFGWACACDFRIADDTARFNNAFLDVGVAGDMGAPWTLSRIVGAGKARELCFLPGKFGADEALRIGLVSRVVPAAEFDEALAAFTDRLLASAPIALTTLKANFVAAEKMSFPDFIALESERHVRLFQSDDTTEAFKAYAAKRKPVYHGR
jgi:2-(1,2-epoxy-1,2-dihydrophenyl)acetyl-CoA isomerase